jgi:potassium-transporting ATPase potassium-binding subunit
VFLNSYSAIQRLSFVAMVTILVKPLGGYIERVFSRRRTGVSIIRFSRAADLSHHRVDPSGVLRLQQFLPGFFTEYLTTPSSPELALNTAIGFSTIEHPGDGAIAAESSGLIFSIFQLSLIHPP